MPALLSHSHSSAGNGKSLAGIPGCKSLQVILFQRYPHVPSHKVRIPTLLPLSSVPGVVHAHVGNERKYCDPHGSPGDVQHRETPAFVIIQ